MAAIGMNTAFSHTAHGESVAITTADDFTPGDGKEGADTFVRRNSGGFGSDTTIQVKSPGGVTRIGYVRFDLSTLSNVVEDALLELTVSGNSVTRDVTFHVYGLNDGTAAGGGKLGEDWSETSMNWSNAPALNNSNINVDPTKAVLLGNFFVTPTDTTGTVKVFSNADSNVSDGLVDFLNADTNGIATFIIKAGAFSSTSFSTSFYSKEGDLSSDYNDSIMDPPTLKLTVVPLPAAAWMGIVMLGGLGGTQIIRRRQLAA